MPRAFSDRDRDQIRAALLATAQDRFAHQGFRATTVAQLARGAGISKGAFYLFFPSKEALLLTLVEEIETELHRRLAAEVEAAPEEALRTLFRSSLAAKDEHPLAGVALEEDVVRVLRSMSAQEREAFLDRDVAMVRRLIVQLADSGVVLSLDPLVLTGILRSLVFVGLHADDIGIDVMPAVQDLLVESLVTGLTSGAHAG